MNRSSFMIVLLLLFIVGLFVLFNSVPWGQRSANSYLMSQGGGMDATQFTVVLQEYISAYRWMGGILSLIAGLGFVRTMELR